MEKRNLLATKKSVWHGHLRASVDLGSALRDRRYPNGMI